MIGETMKLTIIYQDNLVVVNGVTQKFDLSAYDIPEFFWALQWNDNVGELEFLEQNVSIDALPEWTTAIIAEHSRKTDAQKVRELLDQRRRLFINNGTARQDRIRCRSEKRRDAEQQTINNFVRNLITNG